MKKSVIVAFVSAVLLSIAMSSCASFSEGFRDFSEGFREGWNSTAPEEYRY
ncbi:MAG: hypothetical protein J6R48_05515 [Muribaculaceae bacterium]|nr:hypothetical protein [Muribaculaceae bacterium]